MKTNSFRIVRSLPLLLAAFVGQPLHAAIASYFVGVDGLATLASGTYAGLPNPNHQRLTFLYAHTYVDTPETNHYHSKSTLGYTGPNLGVATATVYSASDYTPEAANPRLILTVADGGLYDGKRVSSAVPGNDFSNLRLEDTGKLGGFAAGSGESILFNAASGRWNGSLAGADVHLQLVSLTAGLHMGNSSTPDLLANPGDEVHLDSSFSFTPVFWTDADAAEGGYTARFKLTDANGLLGDSGTFEYRFQVIPEPSSLLIAALGGGTVVLRRRRVD